MAGKNDTLSRQMAVDAASVGTRLAAWTGALAKVQEEVVALAVLQQAITHYVGLFGEAETQEPMRRAIRRSARQRQ